MQGGGSAELERLRNVVVHLQVWSLCKRAAAMFAVDAVFVACLQKELELDFRKGMSLCHAEEVRPLANVAACLLANCCGCISSRPPAAGGSALACSAGHCCPPILPNGFLEVGADVQRGEACQQRMAPTHPQAHADAHIGRTTSPFRSHSAATHRSCRKTTNCARERCSDEV